MHGYDASNAKARAGWLAGRQAGRVGRAQLHYLGIERGQIANWVAGSYLTWVLPRVFAVGHRAPSVEASLFEAVLYAGPGAMVSYGTAAWWLGLIEFAPSKIHVSTPRRCRSRGRICAHDRRDCERIWHRHLPATTIEQTVLDLAATEKFLLVRKALARLDYRGQLDLGKLQAICGSGRPGSRVLRRALKVHQPGLAYTNGPLEEIFFVLCEGGRDIPLPLVGVRVHGILVDAHWPEQKFVAELDGLGNHRTPAQIRRDRRNELTLRGYGIDVVRYDWDLVHVDPQAVRADLRAQLAKRS